MATKEEREEQLRLAASNGWVEEVRVLLSEGIDKDCVDGDGWTPLHYAAMNSHVDVVQVLIDGGRAAVGKVTWNMVH